MIDYKLLLLKYMAIVSNAEGVDFLAREGEADDNITSASENSELRKLSKESSSFFGATGFMFKDSAIS